MTFSARQAASFLYGRKIAAFGRPTAPRAGHVSYERKILPGAVL